MKRELLVILAAFFMMSSCDSQADTIKNELHIGSFSGINIDYGIDLFFTQEEPAPIIIEATPDLIAKTIVEVENDILFISRADEPGQKHDEKNKIKVYVSAIRLDNIVVTGGAEFSASEIKGEELFSINASKGGGVKIDHLHIANDIQIDLAEGADCELNDLRVANCTLNVGKACDAELHIISEGTLSLVAGMASDVILKGEVSTFIMTENRGADIVYRELKYDTLVKE